MTDLKTSCGLFKWRPAWLQPLADKKVYALIFSIIGAVQGMGFTYMASVLSNIEKQFGIKSEEAAWVYSGNEMSQIFFLFFLPFLSKVKKRPLWTSLALLCSSLGLAICSTPYLFRDKTQYEGGWHIQSSSTHNLCGEESSEEVCQDGGGKVRDYGGMATIFIGIFLTGIGSAFFYSVGIPYIDDNVPKSGSPITLSLILAGRVLGPSLGFLLGSATLRFYVVPDKRPEGITEGDPGWLGAWWLGFLIVAAATAILAPFLSLFPELLPANGEITDARRLSKKEEPTTLKEYFTDLLECSKRLMANKVYVFNSLSAIFMLFGIIGFSTFIPKYFEFHFRQNASSSGGIGGMSKTLGSVIGLIISGIVIQKFKFTARTLSAWNVVVSCVTVLSFLGASFLACPKLEVQTSGCQECNCQSSAFQPTCHLDSSTLFLSPCEAGCKDMGYTVDNKTLYSNCSCINIPSSPLLSSSSSPVTEAVKGFCPFDCDRIFYLTLALFTISILIGSTGRLGNQLISLRAIDPEDKSASMVLLMSALSLFVFFPSPIIFGKIMDRACLVWGSSCGETTNCLLYDTDMMRHNLMYFVSVCAALATVADVGVFVYCKDVVVFDDEEEEQYLEMEGSKEKRKDLVN